MTDRIPDGFDPARKLNCEIVSALTFIGISAGLATAAQHIKGFAEGNPWWEDPVQNMKNDLINVGTSAATYGIGQGLQGVGEIVGNAMGTTAAEGGAVVASPLAPTPATTELAREGITASQVAQGGGRLGDLANQGWQAPTGAAPMPGVLDNPALQYAHIAEPVSRMPTLSQTLGRAGGNLAGNALRAEVEGQDVGQAVLPGLAGMAASGATSALLSSAGAPGFTSQYAGTPGPGPNPVSSGGADLMRATRDALMGKNPAATLTQPLPGLAGSQASDMVQRALQPQPPNVDPFSQRQGLYGQPNQPGMPRPYGAPGLSRYDEIAMGSPDYTGGY